MPCLPHLTYPRHLILICRSFLEARIFKSKNFSPLLSTVDLLTGLRKKGKIPYLVLSHFLVGRTPEVSARLFDEAIHNSRASRGPHA